MAEVDAADAQTLRRLVDVLVAWPWPLAKSAALTLVGEHGWSVLNDRPKGGAELETGLIDDRPWASLAVLDGFVTDLTITTARFPGAADARVDRPRRTEFAAQVGTVSAALGAPDAAPIRGRSALWELPSGATLKVQVHRSVFWVLTSPKFAEIYRDLQR